MLYSLDLVHVVFHLFSATEESCSIKRATSLPGQDTYLERVSRAPNKTPHIHRNGQSRAAEILYIFLFFAKN